MLPDNIEDAFELSPIQKGMLYDTLINPESDVYVTYVTVEICGVIDVARLKRAWEQVFNRHQSLRAQFHWLGLDEPLQVIVTEVELDWQYEERTEDRLHLTESERQGLILQERKRLFDLSRAPLSRFRCIKTGEGRWTLLWTVHHLLADGLSTPTILEDVQRLYAELESEQADEQEEIFQYADYIAWLDSQDHEAAVRYWQSYLRGAVPTPIKTAIPFAEPEGNAGDALEIPQVRQAFTQQQSREIDAFCQNNRLTLSTFLHGLWALFLGDYCGTARPLFASTVSGRHAEVKGMNEAVGLYLNAQPRYITVDTELTLVDWLSSIQDDIHAAAEFDYSSLADIQSYIAKKPREPAFESIITIGGHPSELDMTNPDLAFEFTNIRYQSTQSHYALAFLAFPGRCLEYSLVYDRRRFAASTISRMSIHLNELLARMIKGAEKTPLAIRRETSNVDVKRFSGKRFSVNKYDHRSIHAWIEETVDKTPDNVAVSCAGIDTTFRELDDHANQIARMLAQQAGSTAGIVGLLLPRGERQVAALLGILKAGCTYVPLDPAYPQKKLIEWIDTADIGWVITDNEWSTTLDEVDVSCLDVAKAQQFSTERLSDYQRSDLAYVMFTSGSTGNSKGVMISHANLVYSTAARIEYYKNKTPVFLLLSSIAFDSSVAGLYWTLCGGGRLVLPAPEQEKDLESILQLIDDCDVTHTLCLPSYYELLLQHPDRHQLKSLETIIVAGEVCRPAVVEQHQAHSFGARLYNEYGPTEACVWSSVHEVIGAVEDRIPVGEAIGTTFLQVYNDNGMPCPQGVEGEIHIGGGGVSPGYLGVDESLSNSFIDNTILVEEYPRLYRTGDTGYFNDAGELVYTGRMDRQLKLRGYRIEPAEIEKVLESHPSIAKAVAVSVAQSALSPDEQTQDTLPLDSVSRLAVLDGIPESVIEHALKSVEQSNTLPVSRYDSGVGRT